MITWRPPAGARAWIRRGVTGAAVVVGFGVLVVAGGELWVRGSAHGHTFTPETVPAAPVALVLGAQVDPNGAPSAFLAARLEIARGLLATGKVKAILVSGDHGRWEYDEPAAMASWLRAHGVPDERIALDYAGFDTYDSCARARRIFAVRQAIVVTQTYHLDRAVALCRALGVDASGVGDDTARVYRDLWRRAVIRERGAVVKAVVDVVSHRDPVYLGPHERSVEDAVRAG
jgi:vancomycin permeability regulator SanA